MRLWAARDNGRALKQPDKIQHKFWCLVAAGGVPSESGCGRGDGGPRAARAGGEVWGGGGAGGQPRPGPARNPAHSGGRHRHGAGARTRRQAPSVQRQQRQQPRRGRRLLPGRQRCRCAPAPAAQLPQALPAGGSRADIPDAAAGARRDVAVLPQL